nr:transposase, mutator type [Tanacetum cinerariifolium]
MKRIVNLQSVIDKCTGPLTPTATRIMESIKKETHLMKVQWNGANKYQVSSVLGDQCVMDVGQPKKKRKRPKHEDEPFVKDEKVSKKGRIITCQSCGNIGHNKATCKGQGVGVGVGVGVVIGLFAADGQGGEGFGVDSQGSSHSRWTKRIVQTERISPQKRTPTQPASQPSTNSQVPVSETRNADEREMGDGIPHSQV